MNENLKKYFVKDIEINSIKEDKLNANDVLENINLVIDNTKPPFSIALTGKSGIGKSSIINFIKEKYDNNKENYNVQKINVWKNDDISIKEILGSNTIQNVQSVENDNVKKQVEKETTLKSVWKYAKVLLVFLASLLITTIIFIFMEYLQNANIYNSNDVFFVENTYMNYRENFAFIFIFSLGLTALYYILNTLIYTNKKNGGSLTKNNSLNNKIATVKESSVLESDKTNIIIIEDIDKLTINKMFKYFEEIKYCNEYNNCVFIVTFDETAVKKAIDVRNEIKLSGNYRPLDFEKVLDKLFLFKIDIPSLTSENIKDYAISIAKEEIPDFLEEYCKIDTYEKIIKNIIITENVTTPRETIKALNNFNSKFMNKQYDCLLEYYRKNASNKNYFIKFNEIINDIYNNLDESTYIKYLEIIAENYNCYQEEALEVLNNSNVEIPASVMNILLEKIKLTLTKENYDKTFEFLRNNSESFYEEDGNVSSYVQFLVDYINLSSNPNDIINELDENFTRIGKLYELNKNIKNLNNLDYDKAYNFMAKSIDNGDMDRMVKIFNSILSDENSVQDCIKIEENLKNYTLVDVIECNVDDILDEKFNGNNVLLKNLIEIAANKQSDVNPTDAMKLVEKALSNKEHEEYILNVYDVLNKFDRTFFYEIKRDFNQVIYESFHTAINENIKKAALDCTRFFKNTHLFKTKLTEEEELFYKNN